MSHFYLLLTPVLTLLVVALVGFVGCDALFGIDEVPPTYTPLNLTLTPANNQITLDWNPPGELPGHMEYRVKRHTPGGTYATVKDVFDGTHYVDTGLTNDETYYYRVYTLIQGDERGTSDEKFINAGLTGLKSLITTMQLGGLRKNFSGVLGMRITIGAQPLVAKTVGRYKVPGNTGTHFVRLVDAATGINIPMGGVSIDMTSFEDAKFAYMPLPDAITLNANASYYLVSQETDAADEWYDSATTTVGVDPMLALVTSLTAVNGDGAGNYTTSTAEGFTYGPVDLQY